MRLRPQAVNGPPHDGPAPRLGMGGHPLHHSSESALCPRGGASEERELPGRWRRRTAPACVYHPPHAQAFPQRHSWPSPWGGPTGGGTASTVLPSGPAASSSAQLPDQLYAGHRPGCARYSTQHGGFDHRRPSNVETGTPAPSPISPPKNHQSESKAVFLSPQGSPRPLNPHPTPPRRPPSWLTPPPTTCRRNWPNWPHPPSSPGQHQKKKP